MPHDHAEVSPAFLAWRQCSAPHALGVNPINLITLKYCSGSFAISAGCVAAPSQTARLLLKLPQPCATSAEVIHTKKILTRHMLLQASRCKRRSCMLWYSYAAIWTSSRASYRCESSQVVLCSHIRASAAVSQQQECSRLQYYLSECDWFIGTTQL